MTELHDPRLIESKSNVSHSHTSSVAGVQSIMLKQEVEWHSIETSSDSTSLCYVYVNADYDDRV